MFSFQCKFIEAKYYKHNTHNVIHTTATFQTEPPKDRSCSVCAYISLTCSLSFSFFPYNLSLPLSLTIKSQAAENTRRGPEISLSYFSLLSDTYRHTKQRHVKSIHTVFLPLTLYPWTQSHTDTQREASLIGRHCLHWPLHLDQSFDLHLCDFIL